MDPIAAFYRGERPDDVGRFVHDIWTWDHDRLEECHDYVQWLFPTAVRSAVNPGAPLVTPDTIAAFGADPDLKARLLRSLELMLNFYGLEREVEENRARISRGGNFAARKRNWLTPGNHNHLRITRILTSLQLLGRARDAEALADCLDEVYRAIGTAGISAASHRFWMRSVGRR